MIFSCLSDSSRDVCHDLNKVSAEKIVVVNNRYSSLPCSTNIKIDSTISEYQHNNTVLLTACKFKSWVS